MCEIHIKFLILGVQVSILYNKRVNILTKSKFFMLVAEKVMW